MRQIELLGLKWGDIDWKDTIVKNQRQAQQVNGQSIVFLHPKNKKKLKKGCFYA